MSVYKIKVSICPRFVVSMVYYGLSLGSGNLGGSAHANVCIAGIVDVLGSVGLYLILDRFGRRMLLIVFYFMGAIFCALTATVPPG